MNVKTFATRPGTGNSIPHECETIIKNKFDSGTYGRVFLRMYVDAKEQNNEKALQSVRYYYNVVKGHMKVAKGINGPTCVEMQAHLPKWLQARDSRYAYDMERHGMSMDGSVINADYTLPQEIRSGKWSFFDYSLRELAQMGWGASGYDMVEHVAFEECDPQPIIDMCECGAHVEQSRWNEHDCYVVRGENHHAQMMG